MVKTIVRCIISSLRQYYFDAILDAKKKKHSHPGAEVYVEKQIENNKTIKIGKNTLAVESTLNKQNEEITHRRRKKNNSKNE